MASPIKRLAAFSISPVAPDKPFWNSIPTKLPTTINGTHPRVIRDSYQQKMNPIIRPPTRAKRASTFGAKLSLATPLIKALSEAIALVRTLDWLS